jgi:uncharacterized membrane protein
MKSFFESIRNTIISGIVLLFPLFAMIFILQKIWYAMTGFGQKLATFLDIRTVAGVGAAPVMTTIVLLLIFYFCGLIVRFAMVTRMRDWIERNMLLYIPGYLKYKVKMEEKLMPPEDNRPAVLVKADNGWKPGLLMGSGGGKAIVFLPGTPDTDNGEVVVVPEHEMEVMTMTAKELKASLQMSGRGLRV